MGWTLHVLLLGLLLPGLQAFKPLLGNSITHREITEMAILLKTAEVCRALAITEWRDFPIPHHFTGSRALITDGMASIKANIRQENFISARFTLGKICHTLQVRGREVQLDPIGGINKDDDGHLHRAAAAMAVDATMELLEDIRGAAGETNFLRLMGITHSSVLCFVIDTTGSMSDDIEAAKRVSFSITDSKKGTQVKPSSYILVPFSDPARRRRDTNGYSRLYQEVAEASGGQAIVVTKDMLPQATDIIVDSSTTGLVTVLQVVRNPGGTDYFSFTVDASLRNITTYLTGSSLTFSFTSPSGVSQSSYSSDGPLGTIKVVGNLHTIRLDTQTGLWEIRVTSAEPYTLKVTGRSSIDFVYNIVEDLEGSGSDFTLKEGRLRAGGNGTLLLSVVGGDSLTVTEVSLVEVSGLRVENSTLKPLGEGDYLVSVEKVPDESFVILLKGVDGMHRSPQNSFQRQSNTQLKASSLTLTALTNGTMEPGVQFTVPFTVRSNGTAGNYTIRSRDNRGFITSAPSSLLLDSGGSAQGSVQLEAPGSTPSGTDVTLTIVAESPSGGDSNYAVLRLTVLNKVTDFSRPVCQVESVSSNCSMNCSESWWELSVNLTDGNGTGIQRVSFRLGDGTLDTATSLGEGGVNITFATYNASCCSPNVELEAVDAVGNVGTCFHSIRAVPSPAPRPTSSATALRVLLLISTALLAGLQA
ncbi:hypothetical protein COCON_G00153340 [Conger conger]|uniref:von Willebrand factor A domain-containing protein 7-like n=1 Tax=Conger conger TaxID=82655 RepID=A0A9Q1D8L5_CONCO|nr:hypothetical protein COCON_G00153340 [Conger conger]